jgi:hypothetical protein
VSPVTSVLDWMRTARVDVARFEDAKEAEIEPGVCAYTGFMRRPLAAIALALGLAAPASAQVNEYEARYGTTVEVSVDTLLSMPEQYIDKAVRTRGELEMIPTGRGQTYGLRGAFGGYLYIYPRQEISYEWEQGAKHWTGREVEVTGAVGRGLDQQTQQPIVYITIWGYLAPPDERKKGVTARETTLEDLITRPDEFDGKTVSVRGQFRGENLFGDLPSSSRVRSADWVIKDDMFAAWVTGKKPKGAGWSLDASLKRDTGKWLQVMGRVRVSNRVVTLEAVDITLTKAPGEAAAAEAKPEPTPPPPPRPKRPPMVAFSLPLDGEREVPRDTVFKIQFSRDMDEASLKEHVVFRYAGRVQPGDNALDAVKVSYDGGLRTLRIDPGDLLRPGRVVEVVLLPGIQDLDGMPLETRPGIRPGAAADVLRFQVQAPGLTGDAR